MAEDIAIRNTVLVQYSHNGPPVRGLVVTPPSANDPAQVITFVTVHIAGSTEVATASKRDMALGDADQPLPNYLWSHEQH